MRRATRPLRILQLMLTVGLFQFAGCLLTAQNTLELLLSPEALRNALRLPLSGIGRLLF